VASPGDSGPPRDRAALAILVAAVLGVAISAYLTIAHYAGASLVCAQAAGIDCSAVTSSSYALVPGTTIPISLAGLAWSAVSGAAAIVAMRADPPWLRPAHVAWAAAGVIVVLYLVNAEVAVIHRICEWCTALHVLIGATFFLALARMR